MGLRIISGTHRGRRLAALRGKTTRPTAERVREAIFNILADRPRRAQVLDLYAGSGAMGLEAISRGAAWALMVEKDPAAVLTIQRNIGKLALESSAQVLRWDIERNLSCLRPFAQRFDLVFVDPPYDIGLVEASLGHLAAAGCLKAGAWVVVECGPKDAPAAVSGFNPLDKRKYGKTTVIFLQFGL